MSVYRAIIRNLFCAMCLKVTNYIWVDREIDPYPNLGFRREEGDSIRHQIITENKNMKKYTQIILLKKKYLGVNTDSLCKNYLDRYEKTFI